MSCRHRHGPWCCDYDDNYSYGDFQNRAYPGGAYAPPVPQRHTEPRREDLEARLVELEAELTRIRRGLASQGHVDGGDQS